MYLFEGQPGSGKTTLALEFLLEGVRKGDPALYITLSETERELHLVAKRHGWSLEVGFPDVEALREVACECYETVKAYYGGAVGKRA